MFNKAKVLALGVVLAAAATSVAKADTITGKISITGTDIYTSNSINFTAKGDVGSANGTLGAIGKCDSCVFLTDFNFDSSFTPTTVFSAVNNGTTISLLLSNISSATVDENGVQIVGMGTLSQTGYEDTTGKFVLTSQLGGDNTEVTFSATSTAVAPTPEPSTLMLLGTGLVGSAGALYRRRRLV